MIIADSGIILVCFRTIIANFRMIYCKTRMIIHLTGSQTLFFHKKYISVPSKKEESTQRIEKKQQINIISPKNRLKIDRKLRKRQPKNS